MPAAAALCALLPALRISAVTIQIPLQVIPALARARVLLCALIRVARPPALSMGIVTTLTPLLLILATIRGRVMPAAQVLSARQAATTILIVMIPIPEHRTPVSTPESAVPTVSTLPVCLAVRMTLTVLTLTLKH